MPEIGNDAVPAPIHAQAITDKKMDQTPEEFVSELLSPYTKNRMLVLRTAKHISDLTLRQLEDPGGKRKPLQDDFLRSLVPNEGDENRIQEDMIDLRASLDYLTKSLARRFRKNIPKGVHVRFFTGSFSPDFKQEQRIQDALKDEPLRAYLKGLEMGEYPLETIAQTVTTDSSAKFPITWFTKDNEFNSKMAEKIPDQLTLADIGALYRQLSTGAPDALNTNAGKIITFIMDIAPYRTLNVAIASISPKELAQILPEFYRQVGIAGVEPDVVALYTKDAQDTEAVDVIERYIKLTKGKFMGKRQLLGLTGYTEAELQTVQQLFSLIRNKRIHFSIGEIKMMLYEDMRSGNSYVLPTTNKPNLSESTKNFYERGLGYRVWGMMQQMLAVYEQAPKDSLDTDTVDFLQAVKSMSSPPRGESRQLQTMRAGRVIHKFLQPFFIEENTVSLVVGRWPIFRHVQDDDESWHTESTLYELKWTSQRHDPEIKPHLQIPKLTFAWDKILTPKQLYEYTRQAGRMMLKKLTHNKRVMELLAMVKSIENQDPGEQDTNQDPGTEVIVKNEYADIPDVVAFGSSR